MTLFKILFDLRCSDIDNLSVFKELAVYMHVMVLDDDFVLRLSTELD